MAGWGGVGEEGVEGEGVRVWGWVGEGGGGRDGEGERVRGLRVSFGSVMEIKRCIQLFYQLFFVCGLGTDVVLLVGCVRACACAVRV